MNPSRFVGDAGSRQSPFRAGAVLVLLAATALPPCVAWAAESGGTGNGVQDGGFSASRFLGPFHMLAVHLPIGFVVAAAAMEAHTWWSRRREGYAATHFLVMLAILSGLVAAALGVLRAAGGGYDPASVDRHRWAGFSLLGVLALTAVATWRSLKPGDLARSRVVVRVLLAVAIAVTGATGHLGGNLTHGAGFLTAHAPPFVTRLLAGDPRTPGPSGSRTAALSADGGAAVDSGWVWDLLKARCQSCHGAEKHKGGLRLDERAALLKAGDSGVPAVVPGDPLKSRLMHVLLVPRDHDEAMPPAGKEGLSPEEIVRIADWIHAGAP